MPNYVTNEISFSGNKDVIEKIINAVQSDDGQNCIDFNKIIPMPKSLDVTCGSITDTALSSIITAINPDTKDYGEKKASRSEFIELVKKASAFNSELDTAMTDVQSENIKLGKTYLNNILEYGVPTWYEWCNRNWGTKWNASDTNRINDHTMCFQTAWAAPIPVIKTLAEKYPDVTIHLRWADEDTGYNTGIGEFKGLTETITEYEGGSKESFELAAELWDMDLECEGYRYDEEQETYVYTEDK